MSQGLLQNERWKLLFILQQLFFCCDGIENMAVCPGKPSVRLTYRQMTGHMDENNWRKR